MLTARIEQAIAPFVAQVAQLDEIPGIGWRAVPLPVVYHAVAKALSIWEDGADLSAMPSRQRAFH